MRHYRSGREAARAVDLCKNPADRRVLRLPEE
jgi:hypothetical protein